MKLSEIDDTLCELVIDDCGIDLRKLNKSELIEIINNSIQKW